LTNGGSTVDFCELLQESERLRCGPTVSQTWSLRMQWSHQALAARRGGLH